MMRDIPDPEDRDRTTPLRRTVVPAERNRAVVPDGRGPAVVPDGRGPSAVDAALLAAAALLAVVILVAPGSGARPVLALVCLALLPGWAVTARLPPLDPLTTVGLTLAFSLTADLLVATALVLAGVWHPGVAAALLGVPSIGLVAHDLYRRRRSPRAIGPAARPVRSRRSTGKDTAS
ncbi:membrane hypothetical protein [Frankia canadensis]|uniref:Uncharacterized protein n=1 Tax=Frankia canadensis TaxID=1836972 RepID=A0A2I2KUA7_9ACTN|nr:hypothetical protein [Frankia canadensis]SNQ49242.1 membrane hypothetical protein [Frankia canadensis]SOU56532.1 membrane hypothetical protein [Frankia canadensis]